MAWTDERLDDFADSTRAGFDRLHEDLHGFRQEVRTEFGSVRAEIAALRSEMHTEIGGLRSEMHTEIGGLRAEMLGMRGEMTRFATALLVCLLGGFVTLGAGIVALMVQGG